MKVTRTVVLLAVLLGLAAPVAAGDMPLLVSADWLRANLGAPDLFLLASKIDGTDRFQPAVRKPSL